MASGDIAYQYTAVPVYTFSRESATAYDFDNFQERVTLANGVVLAHGYGTTYTEHNSLVGYYLDPNKSYIVKLVEA